MRGLLRCIVTAVGEFPSTPPTPSLLRLQGSVRVVSCPALLACVHCVKCGFAINRYCELLKPEWTAAAAKMRKMAGVVSGALHCRTPFSSGARLKFSPLLGFFFQAAVDVVTHQHIAQSLMKDYGFEVKGVPTVIILKPGPDGKKELVQYSGERKTSPIVKALGAAMPEFVARITEPSFDSWQQKPGAKVVLFSKKREPSPQLKVSGHRLVPTCTEQTPN